ncbi:RNA-directed DNA polymerase, eukaryota, reverse transcriptase zinc-binding domain protein, partial [Tanacetum coccineum]
MSGVGKPLLMDKMTKERCLKKAGKMDFARVLVEVSAEEELPNVLEIAYPPLGSRPARVGRLEVKYQWRPPLCTYCKSFGHTTLSCKIRPRTKEEIAAKAIKEAIKVKDPVVVDKCLDKEDGFTTVGRKNRHVEAHQKDAIDGK